MTSLDTTSALRQAGLVASFLWQDDAAEGHSDSTAVESAFIIGTLPEEVHGSLVYVIHVNGTSESGFGYSYHNERTLTVRLQNNGEPLTQDATDEEIAQAEQHTKDEACKEYEELMHVVLLGAYSEHAEDGSYWFEGHNISERIPYLERWALTQGMHFALSDKGYALESATPEERDAYEKAVEEEEEDSL